MVWRLFAQRNAQEFPERKAVSTPPGDSALAADPFEVADQQHSKVDARRHARLAPLFLLLVVLLTAALEPRVEAGLAQQLVQLLVEWMPLRPRKLVGCDEERLLLRLLPLAHRHRTHPSAGPTVRILSAERPYIIMPVNPSARVARLRANQKEYSNGLLAFCSSTGFVVARFSSTAPSTPA